MNRIPRLEGEKNRSQEKYDYFLDEAVTFTSSCEVDYNTVAAIFSQNNIEMKYMSSTHDKKISIAKNTILEPNITFFNGARNCLYTMGAFSYTHSNFGYGVAIGRYCSIAGNIRVFGATHYTDWISTSNKFYNKPEISWQEREKRKINIGNDVWIGSHVALAQNITIGDGAVIATGAVVTKDIPPFAVVGGVPAKIIKYKFPVDIIDKVLELQWWKYHIDDLKTLTANIPNIFLEELSVKIVEDLIKPYSPEKIKL